MSQTSRSPYLRSAFFLIFVPLVVGHTQAAAQTEKDAHRPACTESSQDRAAVSSLIESKDCGVTTKTDSVPVPPGGAPQNTRLFWVLPNYFTVENHEQLTPLSVGAKFKLYGKTMSDPVTISVVAAIALIRQARNSNPTYGQGFQGYDKRFGTFYADTAIGTLMTTAVFPTVLRQDPRYFRLGTGSKWHRAMYSVSRTFVTRADSGALQVNYSEIAGRAVAAGISNAYYPQSQRTLGNTVNVWGTAMLLNMVCNVAEEFWPDLRRKIRRQKPSN
jgi:hypothetical protein